MNAGGRLLSGAAFSYHTAAKPQQDAPPFALCRIVPTFVSVFFIGDNRFISRTYRDVLRPFLIRRGRPPLCLHNDKKRLSSLNTETTTTKGRQTNPKRPFFFCLLHSFAVCLQRIGMQRETTTRPIFKSKGGYLLKIGKYHAFPKSTRANRAACVWFESTPPPLQKAAPARCNVAALWKDSARIDFAPVGE